MPRVEPKVSIGMPVFDGERYISEAIESILSQTFSDLELIISDNASTDGTQAICEYYAERDSRIRYRRTSQNLGAAANHNYVFKHARGSYFKWAAHDDICAPTFLERCIEVLEQDESVVLCHSRTSIIDENGNNFLNYVVELNTMALEPHTRFGEAIRKEHWCYPVFGLFRADVLKKTPLIAGYTSSDRVLLAEMCLLGCVFEVPERLFLRRSHPETSTRKFPKGRDRMAWFDPSANKNQHYLWLKLRGYLEAIHRAPFPQQERALCYGQVAQLLIEKLMLRASRRLNKNYDLSHIAVPVEGVEWK